MILLDTIGDLRATHVLADIVFVGGSIVDRGGHNVVEPAAAGVAVVTGAHTQNFHAVIDLMLEAGAIVQLPPLKNAATTERITKVFAELLANSSRRDELGHRAKNLCIENQGATDRKIKLITPLLS